MTDRDAGAVMLGSPGTMALPEGGRVDFARMRAERRARVFEQMEANDLDALVLGREDNARYASGARRLWTAFTRPFGPGCVVVRSTGQVHVLSSWDDGIPDEIPRENLYGITWNPAHMVEALAAIPGLPDARRIGTDGMSPGFERLIGGVAPSAELVDGDRAMRSAKRHKTADELACITTAVRIAEAAHDHARFGLQVGVSERELVGRFVQRMTDFGITTPAAENIAVATSPDDAHLRRIPDQRRLTGGELVAFDAAVLYSGYEGGMARTAVVGEVTGAQQALADRCVGVLDALVAACGPDATGAELVAAYRAAGGELPPWLPVMRGVGLGYEPPVVTDAIGHAETLEVGMTITAQAWVWEAGLGGCLLRDTLVVVEGGAVRLSKASTRLG